MAFSPTQILSQSITPAALVLNLEVTFDKNFIFKQHIENVSLLIFTISAIFAGLYHFPLLKPLQQL